jgi:hypothetical protein
MCKTLGSISSTEKKKEKEPAGEYAQSTLYGV